MFTVINPRGIPILGTEIPMFCRPKTGPWNSRGQGCSRLGRLCLDRWTVWGRALAEVIPPERTDGIPAINWWRPGWVNSTLTIHFIQETSINMK